LGEQERQNGQPLLALRAEAAEVAAVSGDEDVVEMRAGTRDAPPQIAVETRLEQLNGRRLAVVAQLRAGEPERGRVLGERRAEQLQHLTPRDDELRTELRDLLRPGSDGVPRRRAG